MLIEEVPHYRPIVGSAISNDGQWAAVVSPRFDPSTGERLSELFLCDLEHGSERVQVALPDGAEGYSPVFSHDSSTLAFICRSGREETIGTIDLSTSTFKTVWVNETPPLPSAPAQVPLGRAQAQPCCACWAHLDAANVR